MMVIRHHLLLSSATTLKQRQQQGQRHGAPLGQSQCTMDSTVRTALNAIRAPEVPAAAAVLQYSGSAAP
jgi:hypothetical protein